MANNNSVTRQQGRVKKWLAGKGYGFIAREGERDMFVHVSALSSDLRRLADGGQLEGTEVTFTVTKTPKGLAAEGVERVETRPHVGIVLHYKERARIAGQWDPVRVMDDLVTGVGGTSEVEYGSGRLEPRTVRFFPKPMQPEDKFIIRHSGEGKMAHDEYWVYDHRLERVEVLDAAELRRATERAGRPSFELLLGYGVRLEAADPGLAGLGVKGTLVPVEKIDWIESARAPVQRSQVEVTVARPLVEGEFVALRQWKAGGDGFDEVHFFDHNLHEVEVVWMEDLEKLARKGQGGGR